MVPKMVEPLKFSVYQKGAPYQAPLQHRYHKHDEKLDLSVSFHQTSFSTPVFFSISVGNFDDLKELQVSQCFVSVKSSFLIHHRSYP